MPSLWKALLNLARAAALSRSAWWAVSVQSAVAQLEGGLAETDEDQLRRRALAQGHFVAGGDLVQQLFHLFEIGVVGEVEEDVEPSLREASSG